MAVLDKKVKLGLVLTVEKDGKIINVPISDVVDINQIKIQSDSDIQFLADSMEKFVLDHEEALAKTVATNIIDDSSDTDNAAPEYSSKKLKKKVLDSKL